VSSRAPIPLFTDDADLAVEVSHVASVLGIDVAPQIDANPLSRARSAEGLVGVVLGEVPTPTELVDLALGIGDRARIVLALTGAPFTAATGTPFSAVGSERERALAIALDLGIPAVTELRPLLSALKLLERDALKPAVRALPPADRRRIDAPGGAEKGHGRLLRIDTLHLGWSREGGDTAEVIGEARDVGEALAALRAAQGGTPRARAVIDGVDQAAIDEVLFGPARALSDPASKAVLERYGLPMPVEELCSSPSRAAAEAARIGFPVRVSLASPDLRLWDHPDLGVDGVSSAAGVRDAFRQITSLATERSSAARLLGVHVTAATAADALIYIRAKPSHGSSDGAGNGGNGLAIADLGFADAHGLAAADATPLILPTTPERLERSLGRLRGRELLLGGGPARRKATLESLSDLLVRVAAFLDRSARSVTHLELRPVAILPTGRCEIREACVTVGDAYQKQVDGDARMR
jgi:hypothetical protein